MKKKTSLQRGVELLSWYAGIMIAYLAAGLLKHPLFDSKVISVILFIVTTTLWIYHIIEVNKIEKEYGELPSIYTSFHAFYSSVCILEGFLMVLFNDNADYGMTVICIFVILHLSIRLELIGRLVRRCFSRGKSMIASVGLN